MWGQTLPLYMYIKEHGVQYQKGHTNFDLSCPHTAAMGLLDSSTSRVSWKKLLKFELE